MEAGAFDVMNTRKSIRWCLALLLLATAGIGNVWADHGHRSSHFGVVIGPVWSPWYFPPPPVYYQPYPPIVIERDPPVYIEQYTPPPPAVIQENPISYWYYCNASRGYYPYVKECPSGWQKVPSRPQDQR